MNRLWQDVRYGMRVLAKKPGFTAAAVLVLALGIGANSAVFSLVNAFLFQPLRVQNPAELAGLYSRDTQHPDTYRQFSYPNYVDLRENNPAFSSLAAMNLAMVGIEEGEGTRRTFAAIVSSNYFSTVGVPVWKGRPFVADEEKPGGPLTAIVSYSFWKKHGEDPQLVGKRVRVNGRLFDIAGITPEGFTGTMALISPEIYVPLGAYGLVSNGFDGPVKPLALRGNHSLLVFGRLKPEVTLEAADSMLAVVASQMAKAYPAENRDQTLLAQRQSRLGFSEEPRSDDEMRVPAIMLLSLASVVLIIACLNLANMMMAQGTARRKEIGIRLAIGGSRGRIVRQLFTEGLMLALLGGAGGILLASWSARLLMQSMNGLVPLDIVYDAAPDVRVLGFTLFFCVLSTVIFGLYPAWNLSKPDVWGDVQAKTSDDSSSGGRRLFSRGNILVMAQLSLSLMMLAAAGMFVRSAAEAADLKPGFQIGNEVLVEVDASLANIGRAQASQLYQAIENRLRQTPGVESVARAATVPFGMTSFGKSIARAGSATSADAPALAVRYNVVSPDYFRTLGIPMLRGRGFTTAENADGSKTSVAIVDKLTAEKLWPGGDALGKRIRIGTRPGERIREDGGANQAQELEVVGVAGEIRERILDGGLEPHLYVPFGQDYQADVHFHLKVAGMASPEAETQLLETIRREIRSSDERLPILSLKTMRGHLDSSMEMWVVRAGAHMLEIFGSVALLLAVIGLYALNAYTVARRTREIGIRMALGAGASSTLNLILGEALKVTAVGVGVGLALAIGVGRVLAGFLYGVANFDPVVLAVAPAVLGAVALLACYVPARRAARVDPMIALRYE